MNNKTTSYKEKIEKIMIINYMKIIGVFVVRGGKQRF